MLLQCTTYTLNNMQGEGAQQTQNLPSLAPRHLALQRQASDTHSFHSCAARLAHAVTSVNTQQLQPVYHLLTATLAVWHSALKSSQPQNMPEVLLSVLGWLRFAYVMMMWIWRACG